MRATRTINIPERIFDIVCGHLENEAAAAGDEHCGDLSEKLKAGGAGKFELDLDECAIIGDEFNGALECGCYEADGKLVEASIAALVRRADKACSALRRT